ncbi:MAG TPA: family 2 glycosyl transferase [Chloroflexi bacterium]|nr:family 2 glycosyl transferase [Chloroflexota bacterium]HHW88071.1 glycosyltransferase [Chloroflexota bacterium]
MIALPLLVTAALTVLLTIAATNSRNFPRLRPQPPPDSVAPPAVSVLIPARNEAPIIGATLDALLTQQYPNLEILVLDDRSDDGTADVVATIARRHPQVRLLCGRELPPGWTGKNWACAQLGAAARGDLLVFTDADVRWQPGALYSLVATLTELDADLLTVWPTQITLSWGERLTVPLMALAVMAYLPVQLAQEFHHPLAAAANGQCMAFRRPAYAAIGGHTAVRSAIVEDVQLAQRIKAAGLHLRMADGAGLIECRMYAGGRAAIDGYTKNILAGHATRFSLLALSTLFHWSLFLLPWLWLALGWAWPLPGWPGWPLLLVAAGVTVRGLTAYTTRQRVGDALLLPVSVLLFTFIAARAVWWRIHYGGVLWKGRVIHDA